MFMCGGGCDVEKPGDREERLKKDSTPRRGKRLDRKAVVFGSHTPPPPSPRSTSKNSSNSTHESQSSPPRSIKEAVHRLSIAVENLKVDADEAAFETSAHKDYFEETRKLNITTVNILRITDIPFQTESMYIHIHDSMHSFRTKSIDRDVFRASFEFDSGGDEPIEIYIKSTKTNEIIYATSIDDLNTTEQVLKLRPMSLDPDDDDEASPANPKIWIRLEMPCTMLVEIMSTTMLRPQHNKNDAYASFARLRCNNRTDKTKLVHRSESLTWEGEIFALHFDSRMKLETAEIMISIVDWDIEDVELGSVTFKGGDLANGSHKLTMCTSEDDRDNHVPSHVQISVKKINGIVS